MVVVVVPVPLLLLPLPLLAGGSRLLDVTPRDAQQRPNCYEEGQHASRSTDGGNDEVGRLRVSAVELRAAAAQYEDGEGRQEERASDGHAEEVSEPRQAAKRLDEEKHDGGRAANEQEGNTGHDDGPHLRREADAFVALRTPRGTLLVKVPSEEGCDADQDPQADENAHT